MSAKSPTQDRWGVAINGDDTEFDQKQRAAVIHVLTQYLIDPAEVAGSHARGEVFLDLCRHAVAALCECAAEPERSPAAPALLRYLHQALGRYVAAADAAEQDSPKAWHPNDRNAALARAMYLADGGATRGGRPKLDKQDHFEIKARYAQAFLEAPSWNIGAPTPEQVTQATRLVYEHVTGNEWEPDSKKADEELTRIRQVLRAAGYVIPAPRNGKR
jgi:hypothetical protein